ncbi:hypothetical protein BN871_GC_00110 [Paenibacillus sp. P22]|nr:hypothetical protein BN871_GC_00110 [Paenibacillus sp. P22]
MADELLHRGAARPLPERRVECNHIRPCIRQLIHFFYRRRDVDRRAGIIALDDADDGEGDPALDLRHIGARIGPDSGGSSLLRRKRHPRHHARSVQRLSLQRLAGDDQPALHLPPTKSSCRHPLASLLSADAAACSMDRSRSPTLRLRLLHIPRTFHRYRRRRSHLGMDRQPDFEHPAPWHAAISDLHGKPASRQLPFQEPLQLLADHGCSPASLPVHREIVHAELLDRSVGQPAANAGAVAVVLRDAQPEEVRVAARAAEPGIYHQLREHGADGVRARVPAGDAGQAGQHAFPAEQAQQLQVATVGISDVGDRHRLAQPAGRIAAVLHELRYAALHVITRIRIQLSVGLPHPVSRRIHEQHEIPIGGALREQAARRKDMELEALAEQTVFIQRRHERTPRAGISRVDERNRTVPGVDEPGEQRAARLVRSRIHERPQLGSQLPDPLPHRLLVESRPAVRGGVVLGQREEIERAVRRKLQRGPVGGRVDSPPLQVVVADVSRQPGPDRLQLGQLLRRGFTQPFPVSVIAEQEQLPSPLPVIIRLLVGAGIAGTSHQEVEGVQLERRIASADAAQPLQRSGGLMLAQPVQPGRNDAAVEKRVDGHDRRFGVCRLPLQPIAELGDAARLLLVAHPLQRRTHKLQVAPARQQPRKIIVAGALVQRQVYDLRLRARCRMHNVVSSFLPAWRLRPGAAGLVPPLALSDQGRAASSMRLLSFHRSRNPFHVVPLRKQEHEDDRQHRQDRAGRDPAEVVGELAVQIGQRRRKRILAGIVEHDDRPQEVVPVRHEFQQQDDGDARLHHRHHEPQEDPDLGGAVDLARVADVVGHAHERLPHQEDVEHGYGRRKHDADIGSDEAEPADCQVVDDERRRRRDDHRRDEDGEDERAAFEAHFGQRVSGRKGQRQVESEAERSDDQRIADVFGKVDEPPNLRVVGQLDEGREDRRREGEYVFPRHERHAEQPEKRPHHEQGQKQQQDISDRQRHNPAQPPASPALSFKALDGAVHTRLIHQYGFTPPF